MKKVLVTLSIIILFSSCNKEEAVYPFDQSPYVEFEDLSFGESDERGDVLEISFIIWDREGDIGLGDENRGFPYHEYDVVVDVNENLIDRDSPFNPPFSIIPAFYGQHPEDHHYTLILEVDHARELDLDGYPDYSCENYAITDDYGNPTFLGWKNENYHNILMGFLNNEGIEIDFYKMFGIDPNTNCAVGFDGRMFDISGTNLLNPIENEIFYVRRRDKYSWRIIYKMRSSIWKLFFQNEKREFTIKVKDRELNESNTASSGLVTLEEITAQ